MNVFDITNETQPTFNDPVIHTCYIDGQTFTDPGVYQMHMLMYHGQNVSVYEGGQKIINAPVNPVISQPIGTIAPGVTLTPTDRPYTYTTTYDSPVLKPMPVVITPKPVTTVWEPPYRRPQWPDPPPPLENGNGGGGSTGGFQNVNPSVAGWAMAGIIASMFLFNRARSRSRARK